MNKQLKCVLCRQFHPGDRETFYETICDELAAVNGGEKFKENLNPYQKALVERFYIESQILTDKGLEAAATFAKDMGTNLDKVYYVQNLVFSPVSSAYGPTYGSNLPFIPNMIPLCSSPEKSIFDVRTCRNFLTPGGCSFGRNCNFSHMPFEITRGYSLNSEKAAHFKKNQERLKQMAQNA